MRCAILSVEKHGKHQSVKRRKFITLLGGAAAAKPGASEQLGGASVSGLTKCFVSIVPWLKAATKMSHHLNV